VSSLKFKTIKRTQSAYIQTPSNRLKSTYKKAKATASQNTTGFPSAFMSETKPAELRHHSKSNGATLDTGDYAKNNCHIHRESTFGKETKTHSKPLRENYSKYKLHHLLFLLDTHRIVHFRGNNLHRHFHCDISLHCCCSNSFILRRHLLGDRLHTVNRLFAHFNLYRNIR